MKTFAFWSAVCPQCARLCANGCLIDSDWCLEPRQSGLKWPPPLWLPFCWLDHHHCSTSCCFLGVFVCCVFCASLYFLFFLSGSLTSRLQTVGLIWFPCSNTCKPCEWLDSWDLIPVIWKHLDNWSSWPSHFWNLNSSCACCVCFILHFVATQWWVEELIMMPHVASVLAPGTQDETRRELIHSVPTVAFSCFLHPIEDFSASLRLIHCGL